MIAAAARRRLLHEPRHVPGRADEARRRAHDADAAPHARRRPRARRRRSPGTSRRRSSAAARRPSGATRRSPATAAPPLTLEHHRSAAALDATEWDALLGERGTFTVDGLRFLERAFAGGERPEDEWAFHYYVVRDRAGKAVLATFFTAALWKDDMLASAEVSELVEAAPRRGPVLPDLDDVRDGLAADRGRPPLPGPQRGLEGRAGPADGARSSEHAAAGGRGDDRAARPARRRPRAGRGDPRARLRQDVAAGLARLRAGRRRRRGVAGAGCRSRRACTSARPCCRSTTPTTSSGCVAAGARSSDAELDHLYGLYLAVQARGRDLNSFPLPQALPARHARAPVVGADDADAARRPARSSRSARTSSARATTRR